MLPPEIKTGESYCHFRRHVLFLCHSYLKRVVTQNKRKKGLEEGRKAKDVSEVEDSYGEERCMPVLFRPPFVDPKVLIKTGIARKSP